MRTVLRLAAVLLISLSVISCKKDEVVEEPAGSGENPPVTPPPAPPPPSPGGDIVFGVNKTVLLQLINNVRQSGCNCGSAAMPPVAALTWNDQLGRAAYEHSKDMNTNNFFSHTGTGGTNVGQRVTAQGYTWRTVGENIAWGYGSEEAVINGWLSSPGHCRNMMNSSFKDVGLGREGSYWTQVFGAK